MSDWAMFGAGCFWGVETAFRRVPGVLDVTVGYSGGTTDHPTYEQVCSDRTGHVEVVRVEFDQQKVSYERLVEVFFSIHNPTQVDRQGPDIGSQYRSVIFTHTPEQDQIAHAVRQRIADGGWFAKPVATQIEKAGLFWPAEEYHQRYHEKHGGACGI